ncbi:MAG: HEAT repeat domain-containing protein [Prochlorococcaceae cyanobacterium]
MSQSPDHPQRLPLDPSLLAGELQAEEAPDPLDLLVADLDQQAAGDPSHSGPSLDRDAALQQLLQGDHDTRLQALRLFCEQREPRAVPALMQVLGDPCPILRMSAAYALGRTPDDRAFATVLQRLEADPNGFVRKALAWTAANFGRPDVVPALVRALAGDIAAVRLMAATSLADACLELEDQRPEAVIPLVQSLRIDGEPLVRSNCAWGLGRLHPLLPPGQASVVGEALLEALLQDPDPGVRDDARSALEQLEDPELLGRLQTLGDEGLLAWG